MKTKCIICSFLKNIWKDIAGEFKKPFTWEIILIYSILGICFWLEKKYPEIIMFTLFFGLVSVIFFGCIIYPIYEWLVEIYKKSKEECDL